MATIFQWSMHILNICEDGIVSFLILDINSWTWTANLQLFNSRQGKNQSLSLLAQIQLHTLSVWPFAAQGCIVQLVVAVTLI